METALFTILVLLLIAVAYGAIKARWEAADLRRSIGVRQDLDDARDMDD